MEYIPEGSDVFIKALTQRAKEILLKVPNC